jgi:hypothetical protein
MFKAWLHIRLELFRSDAILKVEHSVKSTVCLILFIIPSYSKIYKHFTSADAVEQGWWIWTQQDASHLWVG